MQPDNKMTGAKLVLRKCWQRSDRILRKGMTKTEKHLYEFGPYRVDAVERLLLRGGEAIPLTPKAADTLLALVTNSGRG